ncbi:MAG: CDP-glycerol glycerophosphotransferase family protein [Alphaproteobacteria bacterium]|nr:CDP-glycerol glycerophosphotransferase family protein [Alphaproteobacteria bacterium]
MVSENQKWNCQSLYDELSKNNKFEPVIILTLMSTLHYKASTHYSGIQENIDFFEKKGIKVEIAYDIKKKKYISLKNFNCDIIFYQQPWFLHYTQEVYSVAKFALTAYVPYCFHMLEEENNYFAHFHKLLWCYFVESKIYEKKYKDEFNAKNVFFSGHTKLDNYLSKKIERPEKQIIIYAPHHYNCDHHKFATWHHNGKQLLEFAQEHQEFEWFFKPHPHFKDSVIRQGLLTEEKAVQYFNKWEKIGTVYTKGDYYPLFKQSSLLITDCISFLAEYMPTENPVFFLKSDNRIAPFTELGEKITSHYYQITDWKIFEQTFERVVKNNDDYLKSARLEDLKSLIGKSDKSAAQNILDYLEGELQ